MKMTSESNQNRSLWNVFRTAVNFVQKHPSNPAHLNTLRSDALTSRSHDYAEQAGNLPVDQRPRRPTDTEIAVALIPALLGQNPRYLGSAIASYHHGVGEELARRNASRHEQQMALMNLSRHYSDAAKLAHGDELAQFNESGRNARLTATNQRMENTTKRISKGVKNAQLTPEQSSILREFNQNMKGIADGPEGWTTHHQTTYLKALKSLRELPQFAANPDVIDANVQSYPVGYKSLPAVGLAHGFYHKFLSSIYHPGMVSEVDVRKAHGWLVKNVPEQYRWQFFLPQEGESWQNASHRLAQSEMVRASKTTSVKSKDSEPDSGAFTPMEPHFDGKVWTGSGPIRKVKLGTLPKARRASG